MNVKSRGALFAASAILVLCPALRAKEVKVKVGDVPGAIVDTLHVHYPSAKFLGFSKEMENGSTLFEAEMKVDGRHVDALLDSVGTIHEEETELSVDELPASVRTALGKSKYAGGKIEGAERHVVPGAGEAPTYELHVELKGKRYELVYDAHGRLTQGEQSDEKD